MRAARLFGIAEVMREEQAAPLPPTDHAVHEHIAGQILAEPGRAVTDAWAVGRSMMLDEAVRLALATSDDAHEDDVPAPASLLTRRELDVVRLVVEGRSNQEIADALFISSHTAANHVSNIMNKLGLDSRTSVAAWAVRQRIA